MDAHIGRAITSVLCREIQIDMLEYTHKEDTWDLDFQVMDDASDDHLIGGLFYNSGSGLTDTVGCIQTRIITVMYLLRASSMSRMTTIS